MGSIFKDIFGGSDSSQSATGESGNTNNPFITSTFGPMATQGAGSTGQIAGLLGLGGGDPQAFQKYLNSTGYQFQLNSGSKAITNNAAARGLLNSGSTLKALDTFGQNIGSSSFSNYLGQLSELAKLGLGAGSLIGNTGQFSKSSSTGSGGSTNGIASTLGALLAFI